MASSPAVPSTRGRLAALLLALAGACGGEARDADRPRASLAASEAEQKAFRDLLGYWASLEDARRGEASDRLRAFLARWEAGGRARGVRVWLAWSLLERGDAAGAEEVARAAERGPAGAARDAATTVRAALLERGGKPSQALALLQPLIGKIVDTDERLAFDEVLVRASLGAQLWSRAIEGLIAWASDAREEDRDAVEQAIARLLKRIPPRELERALTAESAVVSDDPARARVLRVITDHLVAVALEQPDPELARRLLDHGPGSVVRGPSASSLAEVASRAEVAARIAGRTVGLLVGARTEQIQRRSSEVSLGMLRALGLPARAAEPGAVGLVVQDDSHGDGEGLALLAGAGASVLVAGVDAEGALAASRFAARSAIPVLLLDVGEPDPFVFHLGVAPGAAEEALAGVRGRALVGADGVPCAGSRRVAGQTRFPVELWRRAGTTVVIQGDGRCARDVLDELVAGAPRASVVLGLECAELLDSTPRGVRVAALGSGAFPARAGSAPPDLERWRGERGAPPTWYHALGHDAGTLARAALEALPDQSAEHAPDVRRFHARVRGALAGARGALWTSSSQGFDGAQRLPHELTLLGATP